MAEQTLKEKTARGLFWGGLNNGMMQLLNLLFGIILARLLSPSDYGMIGLLGVFTALVGTLQDSGFYIALINRKTICHEDYNAVWWFSALTSFSLYWILFFCAPLIADFYKEPELTSLTRYLLIAVFISSLSIPHGALLQKQLKIKEISIISIVSLLISGIVGIVMAYYGFAFWGIATQTITYVFCVTTGRWIVTGWRPTLPVDFRPLREMFRFSVNILASNLIGQINNNVLTIILGRFYNSAQVGYYNQANKWNGMGCSVIQGMVNSIALPVMQQVEEENNRLIRVCRKMLRFAAFVSMPCMFGLALVAPELIVIAITDKWLPSARLMQIICIGGAFAPIQSLLNSLIISRGRSDIQLWNTVAFCLVQIAVELVCYPYGITTMVTAFVVINILWIGVWWFYVWRLTSLSGWLLLKDILPFTLIAAVSILTAAYAASFTTNIYFSMAIKIIVAAILYMGILYFSGAKVFRESIQQLRTLLHLSK